MSYAQTHFGQIVRLSDGAVLSPDLSNAAWREYLGWHAAGGQVVPPPQYQPVTAPATNVTLSGRHSGHPAPGNPYGWPPAQSETDYVRYNLPYNFALNRIVFCFTDVWASHPVAGWAARAEAHMQSVLAPLMNGLRANGATILHAPHHTPIHPLCEPQSGDFIFQPDIDRSGVKSVGETNDHLVTWLKHNNTQLLIFAGYAINICVVRSDGGMFPMAWRGIPTAAVRDAVLSLESDLTFNGKWAEVVMIDFVEQLLGPTFLSSEILAAL
ncbi:MAG: hypothetical protein Rhirs2KO_18590 [Rhizobiaceae bacterium]